MGNNQGGFHKRERTNDGSQRSRLQSQGGISNQSRGGISTNTTPPSSAGAHGGEDGCPVLVGFPSIVANPFNNKPPPLKMKIAKGEQREPSGLDMIDSEYPVVFKWTAQSHPARNVYLTGSWDEWKRKIPLVKSTSDFSTIINLNPGRYEYKFLVDGRWMVDDNNSKTDNSMGSQNNVVNIAEEDFAVFDALDKDLASSNAGEAMRAVNTTGYKPSHDTPNDKELEKHREFTQSLPDRREFEKAANPPVLPPHLLQVILNKDVPIQCEPNVLPEPNHVMLNHLYALSIKDGVMVLSATHRHRKKYITTLMYRPI